MINNYFLKFFIFDRYGTYYYEVSSVMDKSRKQACMKEGKK
ncbi:hypothetical protein [Clostridium septicum]|nr:hypothetical protein [Clostridium septicum]